MTMSYLDALRAVYALAEESQHLNTDDYEALTIAAQFIARCSDDKAPDDGMTLSQFDAIKRKYAENNNGLGFFPFLRRAEPIFGGDGAVALPWCGMVLCIEKDGYTHS